MKSAYVDARYSSKYKITAEELATLAGYVRELRERVERACQDKIAALGEEPAAP